MEKQESEYNMFNWWIKVFIRNYANFTGRARRAEYWYFTLLNVLFVIAFYVVAIVGETSDNEVLSDVGFSVFGLAILALVIPTLAVAVRRLHDINKSGWSYFIRLVPLVGPIILLVWYCTEGDKFTNNYGADPKNLNQPDFDFEQTIN